MTVHHLLALRSGCAHTSAGTASLQRCMEIETMHEELNADTARVIPDRRTYCNT